MLLGLLDQVQHYLWTSSPNLHYMAQKYKAQIYSTLPKYKAQIILNYSKQFIQIRGLLLNTLFSP